MKHQYLDRHFRRAGLLQNARRIPIKALSLVVILSSSWLTASPLGEFETLAFERLGKRFQKHSSGNLIAQTVPASNIMQAGNQINLNGHRISVAWQRRLDRIGLTDAGLMQSLGLELLNTEDSTQQPVKWFSEPTVEPIVLPTWLAGKNRYLDITDLAQRNGWRVQPIGHILHITMPSTQLIGMRQGQQTWGDRIVLDLERSISWRLTEQPGQFVVTVDAAIDPTLITNFEAKSGNLLTSLQVTSEAGQTVIRGSIAQTARPRVSTLPYPNRLVIDIREDYLVGRNLLWAPGLRWRQHYVSVGSVRFPVYMLIVDPRQSSIILRPIWSDPATAVGISPLIATAERWQAAAAINAGFFNRNNRFPLSPVRVNNRWIAGPILDRGAIAWNDSGEIRLGRLALQQSLTTDRGRQFPVQTINTGYVEPGIGLYTPAWGSTYTSILDNEILIIVENNRVVNQQPTGVSGSVTVKLPPQGYLLAVRAYSEAAAALSPGVSLQLTARTLPTEFEGYPHIVGGGPVLVQNQQIVLNASAESFSNAFATQAAPRSAIGKTADGDLILAAVFNRPGGRGPTLSELAQIMVHLGSVDALNLDGGSSSSLYLSGRLLNRNPRTAARVHSGIGIFFSP